LQGLLVNHFQSQRHWPHFQSFKSILNLKIAIWSKSLKLIILLRRLLKHILTIGCSSLSLFWQPEASGADPPPGDAQNAEVYLPAAAVPARGQAALIAGDALFVRADQLPVPAR
jgi:hypothetical protein